MKDEIACCHRRAVRAEWDRLCRNTGLQNAQDPAARLTCYGRTNPPIATYPIPLPKPAHDIPLTRPDGTPGSADPDGSAASGEDAEVNAKMNSICRGC
jgi:hypothetical protein